MSTQLTTDVLPTIRILRSLSVCAFLLGLGSHEAPAHFSKAQTDARGQVTTFSYSATGKLLSTTVPGGTQTTQHYDERDWVDEVRDNLNRATQTSYFGDGAVNQVTDPLGRTQRARYDGDGRPVATVNGLNFWNWSTLNARGETKTVKDPVVNDTSNGASAPKTAFTYDNAGRLVQRADRRGGVWKMAYDGAGRLLSTTSPLNRVLAQTWNTRGLLGSVTEVSGQKVNLSYDSRGRVSAETGLTSSGATSYSKSHSYDGNSNLLTTTESGKVLARTYDNRDRVASYTNGDGEKLLYAYDANGNVTKLTYPDGKAVTYAYDSRDRLKTVTDWSGRVTTFTWDANSRLTRLARPNGTARELVYDGAGQLTRVGEYLASGKLIHVQRLGYDAGGRTTARQTLPYPQGIGEPALTAAYDADNRLTTYNGTALAHDADGNLLGAPLPAGPWGTAAVLNPTAAYKTGIGGTFTWDVRNRLSTVKRADTASAIGYGYDSEGFLTAITLGTQTTKLTVDPHGGRRSQVLVETAPDGSKTRYVHGLGLLYEVQADGTAHYYHYDALGSTVALTTGGTTVTGTAEYGEYGAITRSTGDILTTPFLWEGRHGIYTDKNTGLAQMRARWYSPQLRRFLNPDPSGFAGGSNFYAFANGNPVSLIDPFGLGAEASEWSAQSQSNYAAYQTAARQAQSNPQMFGNGNIQPVFKNGEFYYEDNTFANHILSVLETAAAVVLPELIPEVIEARVAGTGVRAIESFGAAESLAAKTTPQTFEILDGVRRAKANQLLGNQTVPANIFNAENKLVGQGNIAIDALRSPNKSVIDMSTQVDVNRYMRIQNGLQQGGTLPPINVMPGSRGVRIEDIIFDATGGSR